MNTTANRFRRSFDDDPILDGSDYIAADLGKGVTVRAYVETSDADRLDGDCWTAEEIAAWERGEWQLCEMTLHVYLAGNLIERDVATLCGIDARDGDYLTEKANELLAQIDIRQAVSDVASAAASFLAD